MKGNYAIIVAAGKGRRMQANINKQFINIDGKPMLYYSINTFSKSDLIDGIIVVCSKNEIEYCRKNVIEKYNFTKVLDIVEGGCKRQDSVLKGLIALKKYNCNIVLIHDGARPFVTDKIIDDGIRFSRLYNACACGISVKDTIKVKDEKGFSTNTLDRNRLVLVQTPQCFNFDLIWKCHKKIFEDGIDVTDDTMVVENYGNKVYFYDGSYNNIKITTQDDLKTAEMIIKDLKND
ncbi:2-C-methyl-D-erythritol 4-phosphate cytidylyltransferase [Clostridium sp. cel8]|jgi:2-C-methyl-D-erythritol 4-phosphate cytidylyltransferase|uniref:2-C-methyl-D-erythritol 4-phosphate cytidylyltransferase n=1 Tax=unclassified Clostridium TaxID=2614128 RepID=UPI0015F4535A|nr:2-C-methyl-D-erythritol 4-phosphate cytidylyltransferase [Clostridium sp. cel8]MBA5851788.1 2-C-methyl-D-erythritol 4-phosphate cytidylyltransferase [Clostridium sp. cel8]